MGLNPAQARAVRATFTQVSRLLDGVAKLVREDLNPFDRERPDLTQGEARRLAALVSALRARMLEALTALGIPAPEPEGSARWSARTAFLFSEIALSELTGKGMRSYGALSPEDGQMVAAVAQDILKLVSRAQDILRGVDPDGVEASVARVSGPVGETLAEVWRFARRHELIEVYADIAAVAERAAAPVADIGVFGRTNAGKSSLINALVGHAVLPVGTLPVTAIPLRLARGVAGLRVLRSNGTEERLPLEDLARFSLDTLGAGETDIVAADAFLPTAPEGLRFIDTPGIGSYDTLVSARAFEWLPRCDLGLLLVPAASVLEAQDLALARGLIAAGVEVKLLLSKADLMAPADLEEALGHIRGQLRRRLGERAPEVLPVSAVRAGGAALEKLRQNILAPLAVEHERCAGARLEARVRNLVALAEAAYEGRAKHRLGTSLGREAALEGARAAIRETLDGLRSAAPGAIVRAAEALAAAWRRGVSGSGLVEATLADPAERALGRVRQILEEAQESGPTRGRSGSPPMPPLFTLPALDAFADLRPGILGARVLPRVRAGRRLSAAERELAGAFGRYADRLDAWSAVALAELDEDAALSIALLPRFG